MTSYVDQLHFRHKFQVPHHGISTLNVKEMIDTFHERKFRASLVFR